MRKDVFYKERKKMVEDYIKPSGVSSKKVLDGFLDVPRHKFVPPKYINEAYLDIALPIGEGQTVSQPSLVAIMTEVLRLKGNEKVLEIGTGSGYQAAILSRLAKEVYSVEIIGKLARRAETIIGNLGYKNVYIKVANGTVGLLEFSPYDAIIVTAGGFEVPKPLIDQLKEGGRIVVPLGKTLYNQELECGVKKNGILHLEKIEPVSFVPLVGKYGFAENLNRFI